MLDGHTRPMKPYMWIASRPPQDPGVRYMVHGPILPMEEDEPGIFWRLLGR